MYYIAMHNENNDNEFKDAYKAKYFHGTVSRGKDHSSATGTLKSDLNHILEVLCNGYGRIIQ